jgi:serralysin
MDDYGSSEMAYRFGAFNSTQQDITRSVLKLYSSVSNVTFQEIAETSTQHADLRFARSDAPSTAWAYFPATHESGGDVWVNNSSNIYNSPGKGNYAHLTIVHEIGHALGLEHAHEGAAMPISRDSMEYTVMSYRSYVGASTTMGYTNESWGYAQSLMMYDIAALQHMYGANFSYRNTNTKYTWNPKTGEMSVNGVGQGAPGGNKVFQTVWDGGGTDTYDFSNYTSALTISLKPGSWTKLAPEQRAKLAWDGSKLAAGNIANALMYNSDKRSLIENAYGGSGSDSITGNGASNSLRGNAGNDALCGLEGNDCLKGASGNDTLYGYSGKDTLYGGSGADTFVFKSIKDSRGSYKDTIKDFTRNVDHIDLRSIDASTKSSGNQAFTFIEKAAFTGKAGQLHFVSGVLSGDVNGDKVADFHIYVSGLSTLSKSDFYL